MRTKILTEARSWIGTPYKHQGRVKKCGVDCVGLIAMVGINTGVLDISLKTLEKYSNYSRLPNPTRMGTLLRKHLIPVDKSEATYGDITWIAWKSGMPMHLAILGEFKDKLTLIHAAGNIQKVVEHRLNKDWLDKIDSYFKYPRLA